MRFVLKTVRQTDQEQPQNRETTKYVRKNWVVFVAYYAATSLALGFGLSAMIFIYLVLGVGGHGQHQHKPVPIHNALLFSMAILGVLSASIFLIELVSGPFVFTKDVVCRKCHTRLKVNRVPFFTGKYSRPPKCECGGKIDPAFLWKPDVSGLDSIVK
jgi:hypothetical protein